MTFRHAYETEAGRGAAQAGLDLFLDAGLHDERAHIRAYDRWVNLLQGRVCPSIEDLEPKGVSGPRDLLIDLRKGADDPDLVCVGGALIADCGKRGMKRLSDAPSEAFLSLLAAHRPHVIASRQPIAFEGERVAPDGVCIGYRGILLPLSSDGETVNFVYGTISWREPLANGLAAEIEAQIHRSEPQASPLCASPPWPPAAEKQPAA